MIEFIRRASGHAGFYTLHEQPKPPGIFQRAVMAVKSKAKLSPQPGPEDYLVRARFKSPTHWDKFKARIARIGKPTLKQLMKKNAVPQSRFSSESAPKVSAGGTQDQALKKMREVLDQGNPGTTEQNISVWKIYEGRISAEMQPLATQDELGLTKRLAQFLLNPENNKAKRDLALVVAILATVSPQDSGQGSGQGRKMVAAARAASLVTNTMTQIGEAATAANKWFSANGGATIAIDSAKYQEAKSHCESLLFEIAVIRSGRDMGGSSAVLTVDHDGETGEPIYDTIPGPKSVISVAVAVSAADVSVETAADHDPRQEEPIYAVISRKDKPKKLRMPKPQKTFQELQKFWQQSGSGHKPPVPPKSLLRLDNFK